MTDDAAAKLKEAIGHRIACIDRVTINAFLGTRRSRRELPPPHHVRQIIDLGLTTSVVTRYGRIHG